MVTFACPKCGYGELIELSVCVVSYPILAWDDKGSVSRYGEAEVDWESDLPYSILSEPYAKPTVTYECERCRAQFSNPRRVDLPDRAPRS